MKIRLLLIGLLAYSNTVLSLEPLVPPGLLPTEVARRLLEQDPSVGAGRAGLEVARQEAGILDASPYEWTPKVMAQQRNLQNGPSYFEWNAGIERTIRLPGKAAADRKLGRATLDESQAPASFRLL